jgi:hypothetical protein
MCSAGIAVRGLLFGVSAAFVALVAGLRKAHGPSDTVETAEAPCAVGIIVAFFAADRTCAARYANQECAEEENRKNVSYSHPME